MIRHKSTSHNVFGSRSRIHVSLFTRGARSNGRAIAQLWEDLTMKAAVFRGPRNMRIEQVPDLVCGPDDVLARVLACGICGSDLHGYKLGLWAEDGWVMGHELSFEVTEVGSAVDGIVPGERIFAGSAGGPPCGNCFWCGKGLRYLCERRDSEEMVGYSAVGGYSEAVVFRNVNPGQVMRIPDSVSPEQAAFVRGRCWVR